MTTLSTASATDLVSGVRNGTFTARDVAEACCEQIKREEQRVHAWVHFDPDLLLQQADGVDARKRNGRPLGALPGVPVGIKDIFNTKDMPTQMGSPIWKDFTPGNDARVVYYLRMADALIAGKTVTAEFAVHDPGPTRNPHNPDYMAGTSSTGSAVAVATSMIPLALGTQTAGSIIRPASYTGVYGFKPSFGLVPRTAMLKTTDSLDTIGLFARTVDDLALLSDVVRVHGPDYPISHAALNDPMRRDIEGRAWRVAVVRGPQWDSAEPYAQDALLKFADQLGCLADIEVTEARCPERLHEAHRVHGVIYDRTLAYYFKEEFKQHTLVSGIMYETIERGNNITLEQYRAALDEQYRIAEEMDHFLVENGFDVLLDLSTGGEALRGLDSADRPDNCLIWTLCGLPVANLPAFKGPNGLPFGAQAMARRYSDYLLLNFLRLLRRSQQIPEAPHPRVEAFGKER